jgi:hypothetical protein
MKEFLEKLAPYHFFNYLLPGTLFVILAEKIANYNLYQSDIFLGLLLYYFIGLAISRFGSLVFEPVLKKAGFIVFSEYEDFLDASKKDMKIEALSEVNNMYRTLFTLFFLLILLKLYMIFEPTFKLTAGWSQYILIGILLVMFLFAYRKQSEYITNRVKANKNKKKSSKTKRDVN